MERYVRVLESMAKKLRLEQPRLVDEIRAIEWATRKIRILDSLLSLARSQWIAELAHRLKEVKPYKSGCAEAIAEGRVNKAIQELESELERHSQRS
jgi:hypothetical protein